jgi:hypothetical protein
MAPDLAKLAMMAVVDENAIPVLGDAILESDWLTDDRQVFAMALCLGVPIDPVPPGHIHTIEGRRAWQAKRRASLRFAAEQWDRYAGHRRDWARGVLATMLFEGWPQAKQTPRHGSRSPWLLVWRNATWERRAWEAENRRLRQERRDAREAMDRIDRAASVRTIAQQYSGNGE